MRLSLRWRVLAGLTVVALVLAVVTYAVTSITRNQLVANLDDELLAVSEVARDRPTPSDRPSDSPDRPGDGDGRPQRYSTMFEALVLADGSLFVVLESNVPGERFSRPDLESVTIRLDQPFTGGAVDDDVRYRVAATEIDDTVVVRALPLADVDETMRRMIGFQLVGVAAVLSVLAAVAWWVIHLGVRPLKQMTTSASEIAGGDLTLRVPESSPAGTESGDLSRALNTMLGRIEHAVAQRAESEQRLRQFVADASHELRTPVTTIRGYAELYRHGGLADAAELDDAMRRTEEEAERMGRLVADMLTLAKLDQERPLADTEVDVSSLVADAAADARAVAPERQVSTRLEPGLRVRGDEDRLRQVVANIVGNAIVHTPDGTPIALAVHRTADAEIVVEVVDEGTGMAPEAAARVTERFYRADPSRSRARGGSGLGMAIADAVVGAHGGHIVIESELGVGTTVRVVIPAP